ncbi:fibronectin type III-like domain-contianing protein [Maribacter dokdonensis]|uniref:fibronectin type III-like domain-contianing protein n=1 Tax=Maribacter dokdonensis TaxID=320912 RepID=UPI00338D966A
MKSSKRAKAFNKIFFEPKQSKRILMKLGKEVFQFWDEPSCNWKVEKGKFLISTGTSSRIIDSQDWLELKMN